MVVNTKKIEMILASASPRRKDILNSFLNDFKIIVANVNEEKVMKSFSGNNYGELAMQLSLIKAKYVANKNSNKIIIGADTIVICNNKLLGKPKNDDEARFMLNLISNNTNCVITGITMIYNHFKFSFFDLTYLNFNTIPKAFIESYIASGEPFNQSGGYAIQSLKDDYLKNINGDINNVIGFPLKKFKLEFAKFLNNVNK